MSNASPVWRPGTKVVRRPPGAVQYMSPTAEAWPRLFSYFAQALCQDEAVTEASGTWEPPAELSKLCLKPQ